MLEFKQNSIILFLPELFNHPFTPFIVGLISGGLIVFLIGLLIKYHRVNKEKFGGMIKNPDVRDLNHNQVVYRARACLELLRLFTLLRESRIRNKPTLNSTVKKIIQANEAAIKILTFENNSFFQFIGSWPNNSIKLREVIISLAQFSRSDTIENAEFKNTLSKTVEEATTILNRELK